MAADGARFEILIPDTGGVFRGLSAPIETMPEFLEAGMGWSASLFACRFDGSVVEETGFGIARGDPDYPCHFVAGTEAPVPWREGNRQGIFSMTQPDGERYAVNPQHALASILDAFAAEGLKAVLATEFEFYLTNAELTAPVGTAGVTDLYSMDELQRHSGFLEDIVAAAAAQQLRLGNIISEYGPGQWETNLGHTDPERACLEGLLLRRLARSVARKHGHQATFMAKPFSGMNGSGMHIHLSLWDGERNVLTDEKTLHHAIGGVLSVINEGMAFFAPYENSYRRLLPEAYAPMSPSWGYENRSAAVRVPDADDESATRLEFRLGGADANPLLVAAVLLAGILHGIREKLSPPPPINDKMATGARVGGVVPMTLRAAVDALEGAEILPRYLDKEFLRNYHLIKENEWRHHRGYVSDYDRHFLGGIY